MKLNILIGGRAGQGVNKISSMLTKVLARKGYFTFNYRDYPSLIRGGNNFNIICISDKKIGSFESKFDGIVALDNPTFNIHKNKLKEGAFVILPDKFSDYGKNINMALFGCLAKTIGIEKEEFRKDIIGEFGETIWKISELAYDGVESKYSLKTENIKLDISSGSHAFAKGAIDSKVDIYFAYPMTPATGLMNELATKQVENNLMVFQSENEIAAVNSAIGAAFTGAKTMVGSSGGGFDLMAEALSFQGQAEIPLVVYLASRPGPGTGIPTYTSQADLNVALRAGHGEFPRIVISPGDPIEAMEKMNECFYLSQKFNALSIILTDKHLAESEYSIDGKPNDVIIMENKNNMSGKEIYKRSSYEHDESGNTVESEDFAKKNMDKRIAKYEEIKKEAEKFEMIKIHGRKESKNLIVGWGSTKGAILDAIEGLDIKFLQILYLKPLSEKIRSELEKAEKVILVEGNATGQLGRLIREKTGIKINERILKYDGRPFASDILKKEIEKRII